MLHFSRPREGRAGEYRYMFGGGGWMGWSLGKGNVRLLLPFYYPYKPSLPMISYLKTPPPDLYIRLGLTSNQLAE